MSLHNSDVHVRQTWQFRYVTGNKNTASEAAIITSVILVGLTPLYPGTGTALVHNLLRTSSLVSFIIQCFGKQTRRLCVVMAAVPQTTRSAARADRQIPVADPREWHSRRDLGHMWSAHGHHNDARGQYVYQQPRRKLRVLYRNSLRPEKWLNSMKQKWTGHHTAPKFYNPIAFIFLTTHIKLEREMIRPLQLRQRAHYLYVYRRIILKWILNKYTM
jgi:hypothetical protein